MKLKPCPFCGGEATIKEGKRNDANVTYKTKYVQCVGCGTKTQEKISDGYYGLYCTDEEISELWNTRKPIGLKADFAIIDEMYDYKVAISDRWTSKKEKNMEKLIKEIEYYLEENKVTIRGMSGENIIITDQETGEERVLPDLGYPL